MVQNDGPPMPHGHEVGGRWRRGRPRCWPWRRGLGGEQGAPLHPANEKLMNARIRAGLLILSALALPIASLADDSSPIVTREATTDEKSCHNLGWTYCTDGYEFLLSHPEALAAARPWHACRAELQEVAEYGLLGVSPPWWPRPEHHVANPGLAILEGTGMEFLFSPASMTARPLEIIRLSATTRTSPTGASYLQERLILRDPYVGDIPALLLLPPGEESVPGVVALPGHGEDPMFFRDRRMGHFFPEQGLGLLIGGFRAWNRPVEDHNATVAYLCEGFSLIMARAYEALVALRVLQDHPRTEGRHLGVIGHSGGATAGNLLAWLNVNPARAHVTDIQSEHLTSDNRGLIDCETHPFLNQHWESLVWFPGAPRAVLQVGYGLGGSREDEHEPDPADPESTAAFMPFLLRELLPVP